MQRTQSNALRSILLYPTIITTSLVIQSFWFSLLICFRRGNIKEQLQSVVDKIHLTARLNRSSSFITEHISKELRNPNPRPGKCSWRTVLYATSSYRKSLNSSANYLAFHKNTTYRVSLWAMKAVSCYYPLFPLTLHVTPGPVEREVSNNWLLLCWPRPVWDTVSSPSVYFLAVNADGDIWVLVPSFARQLSEVGPTRPAAVIQREGVDEPDKTQLSTTIRWETPQLPFWSMIINVIIFLPSCTSHNKGCVISQENPVTVSDVISTWLDLRSSWCFGS